MYPYSTSNEALQNVSNHHPLANGQSALPYGYSPEDKNNASGRRVPRAYPSRRFDDFDEDVENSPSNHSVARSRATLPRGWSTVERLETPIKSTMKSYNSQCTRVKTVSHGIRREASKSYGDLSNLRPKSPPIQTLFAPQGHVRERCHHDTGTKLHEVRQPRTNPHSTHSPSLIGQGKRQPLPCAWMSTVMDPQHPKASDPTQEPSCLSSSNEASYYMEGSRVPFRIHGLSSASGPVDFCIPVTRPHPDSLKRSDGSLLRASIVEQLDITNTWHGIQWSEAEELYRIDKAFIEILERLLARELHNINLQILQQQGLSSPLGSPLTSVVRGISFCREQLISEMAEALYSSEKNMVASQSGLLRLYLAANDCLLQFDGDGSRDTSITVQVSSRQGFNALNPTVEAAWAPDSLKFKNLQDLLREGHEFTLTPQYHSRSAFNPTRTAARIKYSLNSKQDPLTWLSWNEEIAGFNGIVPLYSQDPDSRGRLQEIPQLYCEDSCSAIKTLCIEVKAIIINDNGSTVVYERVLNARITTRILPWYSQNAAHGFAGPTQARSQQSKIPAIPTANISACTEARNPRVEEYWSSQTAEEAIDSYADELQNSHHHFLKIHNQKQISAGLPTFTAATRPSELITLAGNYARLAAEYAELALHFQQMDIQPQALGATRPYALAQRHNPGSQVQPTDSDVCRQSMDLQNASHQFARTLTSSVPAHCIAEFSGERTDVRHAAQDLSFGPEKNTACSTLSSLPSQNSDGQSRRDVESLLETTNPTDQSKLDISIEQEASFTRTITPPTSGPPTMSTEAGLTSSASGSRKRHSTSNVNGSTPCKRAKQPQKITCEDDDTADSMSSISTVSDSNSDNKASHSALVPGILCYNSFAPLFGIDDKTGVSMEQEHKDFNESSDEDGNNLAQASDDGPHRRVDSGYHADLANLFGVPTPAASSNGSSRYTSGSVDICSGSDDINHKKELHDQAVLWSELAKATKVKIGDKAEENPRLSADEQKAMEVAMQRSIDEMVGMLDDIFLDNLEAGTGSGCSAESGCSTESEEL